MSITNEALTSLIKEQLKYSPVAPFLKRIWEYGDNKLLVCEFSIKRTRFGIDVAPQADSEGVVSLKLSWRKPYNELLHKFKYNKVVLINEIGFYLNEVVSQCKELSSYASKRVVDNKNTTIGIMNFHFANNYGAVLVPFALLKTIGKLGYKAEIINYVPKVNPPRRDYIEFRRVFLNISDQTKVLSTKQDLNDVQNKYHKIVVGSDQVWRLFDTSTYMLDFVYGYKTLISYAASFGGSRFKKLTNDRAISLLNRFDAISVRENTGVDICNNQFGLPAMQVLDPTLLLTAEDYQPIIEYFNPKVISGDYIAYSIINRANMENVSTFIERMEKLMNITFKNLLSKPNVKEVNSVGGWINDIKNASYVVTDSFHATVFSILHRKKFVCLVTHANGADRIPSLLKMLNIDISSRVVDSLDKITPEMLHSEIDYAPVFERIKYLREKSVLFLENALVKAPNFKSRL